MIEVSQTSSKEEHSVQIVTEDEVETPRALKPLSFLDKFLAVWIFLAIVVGLLLAAFVPNAHRVLEGSKFVGVSAPLTVGLILMMWPILCRISFSALRDLFRDRKVWIHIGFSLIVNWIIAPLFMLALAWAFLPDERGLRQGLILVGLARCIAMVVIWTNIAHGDPNYCALLVAINSLLQIVLYAPLSLLFINVFDPSSPQRYDVSYSLVSQSVGVFLGIPLGAAIVTRFFFLVVLRQEKFFKQVFLPTIGPISLLALLFTIIVIFAAQGDRVVVSIVDVVRVGAPLLVYFIVIFMATLFVCRKLNFTYRITAAQAFTASSNNFELSIAIATSVYGAGSDQALAATVGPLLEVPVLLGLAYLLVWYRRRRGWDVAQAAPTSMLSKEPAAIEA